MACLSLVEPRRKVGIRRFSYQKGVCWLLSPMPIMETTRGRPTYSACMASMMVLAAVSSVSL